MFCKLDVRRKSIVTLALSSDSRKIVVRYFVNRAPDQIYVAAFVYLWNFLPLCRRRVHTFKRRCFSVILWMMLSQFKASGAGSMHYRASDRLSDPVRAQSSKPAAAGLLLWARLAGDVDQLLQQCRAETGSATLSAYVCSWTQTCCVTALTFRSNLDRVLNFHVVNVRSFCRSVGHLFASIVSRDLCDSSQCRALHRVDL